MFKKVSDLSDVSTPSVTEIGNGLYKFTHTPSEDIVFELDAGATISDAEARYISGVISPQDAYLDAAMTSVFAYAQRASRLLEGRWKIDTGTNKLTIYAPDGTTPLQSYDLKDNAGAASSTLIYERAPEDAVP
jgi:hypothetical protein